jgi:hypothetical protein
VGAHLINKLYSSSPFLPERPLSFACVCELACTHFGANFIPFSAPAAAKSLRLKQQAALSFAVCVFCAKRAHYLAPRLSSASLNVHIKTPSPPRVHICTGGLKPRALIPFFLVKPFVARAPAGLRARRFNYLTINE